MAIAKHLGKTGLCVWPNFLSAESLRETRADLDSIQSTGGFQRAGTGQGEGNTIKNLRRDETHWLDSNTGNPTQQRLWDKLDELKRAFNRTLFLGLQSFEGHYAAYPEGGFYHRHRDSFLHDDSRTVSLVLYLNHEWKESDGGKLRIYEKDSHTDVDPRGGTLVCFFSRESEHEVLESHTPRFSFAGWFKTAIR